jgi:tRNA(adenine34) deaminase
MGVGVPNPPDFAPEFDTPRGADADMQWMQVALGLAQQALRRDEVPVGAVLILNDRIVGAGHNACITSSDPTAHAEMVALRAAAAALGNYRLPGATLYVTLEPCAMCAGAIVLARVARVVFATYDPRAGAAGSVMNVLQHPQLNHRTAVTGGVEAATSKSLLVDFFKARRRKKV